LKGLLVNFFRRAFPSHPDKRGRSELRSRSLSLSGAETNFVIVDAKSITYAGMPSASFTTKRFRTDCYHQNQKKEESMHNIDRTNLESSYGEYSGEYGEYNGEYTGEYAGEFAGEYPGEYEYEGNEFEYETAGEFEGQFEGEFGQGESPFGEAEEMELAAELLSVQNEAELDMFFGKLFKKAGSFLKSSAGRALGGALKGIAKKALPILGGAAGNFLLPGVGGAIGSKLASTAGSMLGLELEGLSYEDQEFEVAKQLVRLGGESASNLAQTAQSAPPVQAAQAALSAAAQKFAPGLLYGPSQNGSKRRRQHNGRWIRRGNAIIIMGV
jgi:hypothetical protein